MTRNSQVPQATLPRIRAVVVACVGGADTTEAIADKTGISRRHVDYAVAAAETLLLVQPDNKGRLLPTPAGTRLAATAPGSLQESALFIETIEKSSVLELIAPELLSSQPPSKEDIAKRIMETTALSRATALHRAAMLVKWRSLLREPGKPRPHEPAARQRTGGMWRRLDIRNYRSIESATIELAPFAVIVGPNGSGKSNFADALVFARDVSTDASAAIENRGGIVGIRRWRPTKPTDVTVDLRASNSREGLETHYVRHLFRIHSGAAGNWNFSQETIEVFSGGELKDGLLRRGSTLEKADGAHLPEMSDTASAMVLAKQLREFTRTSPLRNVRRYRLNPEAMRQPQLSTDKVRLDESGANIAVAVRDVRQSGRFEELISAMAQIVPGLQDVYAEPVGRYLSLKFKQALVENEVAEFNATEMSEGALRALGIIVGTLQMVEDELLIIEEPEVSIHVGAANLLFEVLREASTRGAVLITTHSADLLDAAKDEEILVCEYTGGITRIGPLSNAQREVVREGLFSVAELMRSEPLRIESGPANDSDGQSSKRET